MVNTIQVFAISFVLLYFAAIGFISYQAARMHADHANANHNGFTVRDAWDTPDHLPSDLLVMLPEDFHRESWEMKYAQELLEKKRQVSRHVSAVSREEMLRSASGSQIDIRGQRVVARNNRGRKIQVKWLVD